MVKAGVIGQELADKPLDFNFQRAARTDKAVSAARQCCSMWLDLEKEANIDTVPSLINAQLPDDIRVMGTLFSLSLTLRELNLLKEFD